MWLLFLFTCCHSLFVPRRKMGIINWGQLEAQNNILLHSYVQTICKLELIHCKKEKGSTQCSLSSVAFLSEGKLRQGSCLGVERHVLWEAESLSHTASVLSGDPGVSIQRNLAQPLQLQIILLENAPVFSIRWGLLDIVHAYANIWNFIYLFEWYNIRIESSDVGKLFVVSE